MINEKDAIEMINLMLQTSGKETFSLNIDGVTVNIHALHLYLCLTAHFSGKINDTQAGLLLDNFSLRQDNFWIDDDRKTSTFFGWRDIVYENPFRFSHLVRS